MKRLAVAVFLTFTGVLAMVGLESADPDCTDGGSFSTYNVSADDGWWGYIDAVWVNTEGRDLFAEPALHEA